jgi:O-antigen ligase
MNYPIRTFRGPGRPPSYSARALPPLPLPREAPLSSGQAVGLFLFLLVNVLLFIRPADVIPEFTFIPTYEYLIISCFVVSLPFVYRQFSIEFLRNSPISVCVLGLQVAVVLSHLLSPLHFFFIWGARWSAFKFFKILVYYFLLVGLVTTPRRLRRFLVALALMIFALIGIALLHYHGIIYVPTLSILQSVQFNEQTGLQEVTIRLQSLGIFNDPNDLAMILVVGMVICLYLRGYRRSGILGFLWLIPVGILGYGLYLTKSRGGFLGLLAAVMVLFHAKYGLLRAILLSVVVLPVMFMLFQGRQTELSSNEETAVTRIQLWSEGFTFFKQAPIFGNGLDEFQEQQGVDFVPHNTYIHCFAELGFFGGMFFVGAFYYALWGLYRYGSRQVHILDPEQRRLRPFILALTAGYAANMLTLSRLVHQPTYLVLGLALIYLRVTPIYPPQLDLRMSWRLVGRFALVSVVFMTLLYVYVRFNVRWH